MVLAAKTELAATELPVARTVEPVTTDDELRTVAEETLEPFTTLPAATTVPAASVLPPATIAVLATATEPDVNVVPAIVVLETNALPDASVVPAAMMLPPLRLVAETIDVVEVKDSPEEIAVSLMMLLAAAKLPAPRTLPWAIVVALT